MSKRTDLKQMMHEECGKPAYLFVDGTYMASEPVRASMFYKLDGSPIEPGDFVACQSCGKRISITISKEHGLIAI